MPRLIDANEAYKVLTDYYHQRTEIQHEALKEALSKVPTVDAVKVVRCKDCRYQWHTNYMKVPICGKMSEDGHEIHAEDDFYCAKGERRE